MGNTLLSANTTAQAHVPIVSWDISQGVHYDIICVCSPFHCAGLPVKMDQGFFDVNLDEIIAVSPFSSLDELLHQFGRIGGRDGNVVLIFNLSTVPDPETGGTTPEIDLQSRRSDLLITTALGEVEQVGVGEFSTV